VKPLQAAGADDASKRTAALFNEWIAKATAVIADEHPANGMTMRGFSTDPGLPKYKDVYGLKAGAIAIYPMYRGVASLVGMDVIAHSAHNVSEEFDVVAKHWNDYDFFFVHVKYTDSRGEDGDFDAKAKVIEEVDTALTKLLALKPDVLAITGDHSTPSQLKAHSGHPVPLLLHAPATARPDRNNGFGERECARGGLGTIAAADIMQLALAHAGRLGKFGA
jgi:2,3-bisphosphoglycerate-independent phosphoglycerate mutase